MVGYLILEFTFRNWQDVIFSGNPHVQRGQQEDAQDQGGHESADDDDGEGPLRIGADVVRNAAGIRPSVATSMVIMMGRSRRLRPRWRHLRTVYPRTRSWLMYSSMMTPVCTETPNRARIPTPDETLKFVCVK